jgi:hypothetical protein
MTRMKTFFQAVNLKSRRMFFSAEEEEKNQSHEKNLQRMKTFDKGDFPF